jgi:hypothetical protein
MIRYIKKTTDINPQDVVELLQQGISTTRVAYRLGCGRNTVYNLARKGGWQFSPDRNPDMKRGYKKKCVCCGKRDVPEKPFDGVRLYMLCNYCYKRGEEVGDRDDKN